MAFFMCTLENLKRLKAVTFWMNGFGGKEQKHLFFVWINKGDDKR